MSVKIIDNFLPEEQFKKIKNIMMGDMFEWYYINGVVHNDPKSTQFQFIHVFFDRLPRENYLILEDLIKKINPFSIVRIKSNLLTKTNKKITFPYHTDFKKSNLITGIYYLNTNNGKTLFKNGEDVYRIMASAIYNKKNDEITKEERFVGKTTILGAGYGMGAQKFKAQLKTFGTEVNEDQARHIIQTYRETYPNVVRLWREAQLALEALTKDSATSLGRDGVLALVPEERSIRLPSGLLLRYDGLITVRDEKGIQYQYKTRYGWNKIYGGKVIENVCQAIARCIIGEQMIRISKRYNVVLTVHDAVACIAKEEEAKEAQAYVEECMRWTPAWAEGLPVNCESGFGKSYGEC